MTGPLPRRWALTVGVCLVCWEGLPLPYIPGSLGKDGYVGGKMQEFSMDMNKLTYCIQRKHVDISLMICSAFFFHPFFWSSCEVLRFLVFWFDMFCKSVYSPVNLNLSAVGCLNLLWIISVHQFSSKWFLKQWPTKLLANPSSSNPLKK